MAQGGDLLTLRTFLRWDGNQWNSITGSTIQLNSLTTAITLMADYDDSFGSQDTINTVINNTIPTALGDANASEIENVQNLVNLALQDNQDPIHHIYHDGNVYRRLDNPLPIPTPEPTPDPDTIPILNSDLRVNTYTDMNQTLSNASISNPDGQGNFVVAWDSAYQDGDGGGVYAQRYNAQGQKLGAEFRVNETTLGDQGLSTVLMDADGNFAILWGGLGNQGINSYRRYYQADGAALGGEIAASFSQLNNMDGTFNLHNQHLIYTDSSGFGDDLYIFDPEAAPGGEWTEVNPNTDILGHDDNYTHAVNSDGIILTTWDNTARDGSGAGIFGQLVDLDGNTMGDNFQLNTTTIYDQTKPRVITSSNGNFVVLWQSQQADNSLKLMGQIIDAQGDAVGNEFEALGVETFNSSSILVTPRNDGGFQVVSLKLSWYTNNTPNIIGASFSDTGQVIESFDTEVNFPSFYTNLPYPYPSDSSYSSEGRHLFITLPGYFHDLQVFGSVLHQNGDSTGPTDIYLRTGTYGND